MAEKNFWVSWYGSPMPFTLNTPWWISGYRLLDDRDQPTIVAAIRAVSEDDAMRIISVAHDRPAVDLEWRFVNERPEDWVPFCDRFPKADWMQWAETR